MRFLKSRTPWIVSGGARARNTSEGMELPRGGGYECCVSVVTESGAFARELRRWRTRRRWSQLELAVRAGTTQRHLSFIERGRSRPGRSIVLRLAESLGLSLRERNALLLAAGYAPIFAESCLDSPELGAVREALDSILEGHLPYPAVVVRPHGELVAANAAIAVLTEGAASELLQPPVNVLRLALHPAGMGRRVENLSDWGRHVIESLRAQALRSPDARIDEFIAELEGYVPAAATGPDHLGFAVPLRLRCDDGELHLITTLTSFATAVDVTLAELQLEAFLPADDATAKILRHRQKQAEEGRSVDPRPSEAHEIVLSDPRARR
jgi:transcriptional regulator with XRE-family HTH domain